MFYDMARMFVSELLCFIRNNFDKLTVSQLKPVLCSFYKDDDICEAKDILLKDIQSVVSSDTLPRMPNRQGPSKCKQTVDDVLKLFTIADEHKLWDLLPRYVADDLSKIPFLNADSVSTINLSKRLEAMEQRMILLEQTMSTCVMDVKIEDNSGSQVKDVCCDQSDGTPNDVDGETDNWIVATNKKRSNSNRSTQMVHTSDKPQSSKATPSAVTNYNQPQHHKKSQKVLGKRDVKSSSLKAGVKIIQKSVVHIDNLSADCTEELLKDYLLSVDVPVLSCYTAKSWLREGERDQVTAYRICVPTEHRHLLFDPQLWSQGVVIRDWKFRQPQNGGRT